MFITHPLVAEPARAIHGSAVHIARRARLRDRRRGRRGRAAGRAVTPPGSEIESLIADRRAGHADAAVGEHCSRRAVGGFTVPLAILYRGAGKCDHLRFAAGGGRRPLAVAGLGRGCGAATWIWIFPSCTPAVIATMCITSSDSWIPSILSPCWSYSRATVIGTSIKLKSHRRKSRGC